jgi:hypothetical protein
MSNKIVIERGGSGIGLGTILGVAFIVLKLTGYINWSWVWVLSPFWIPFVIAIGALMIFLIFAFIAALLR